MGGQYFSWQHRWGSDLFHRKIIYHIFPNPGQGIEISKIGEVGALAFLIVSKLIGKIFQSRLTDHKSSFTSKNLVSGGHVGNCCMLHESDIFVLLLKTMHLYYLGCSLVIHPYLYVFHSINVFFTEHTSFLVSSIFKSFRDLECSRS